MSFKNVDIDTIMAGCNRKPDELLKEIKDRIDYNCLQMDGTYDLPFDSPMLFDVLKMVIRLALKSSVVSAPPPAATQGGSARELAKQIKSYHNRCDNESQQGEWTPEVKQIEHITGLITAYMESQKPAVREADIEYLSEKIVNEAWNWVCTNENGAIIIDSKFKDSVLFLLNEFITAYAASQRPAVPESARELVERIINRFREAYNYREPDNQRAAHKTDDWLISQITAYADSVTTAKQVEIDKLKKEIRTLRLECNSVLKHDKEKDERHKSELESAKDNFRHAEI
jgi:hypothetical protein